MGLLFSLLLVAPILVVTIGAVLVRPSTPLHGLATAAFSLMLACSVAWLGGRADESYVEAGAASVLTVVGFAVLLALRRLSHSNRLQP